MAHRKNSTAKALVFYGSVALKRVYCPNCNETAFVVDGERTCCGFRDTTGSPKKHIRVANAVRVRKRPSPETQRSILLAQEGRCWYCEVAFGSLIERIDHFGRMITRPVWDHFVPYSYIANNDRDNFVAACRPCNGMKSDRVFTNENLLREYIRDRFFSRWRVLDDSAT